jgi:hypothetical protein
VIVKSHRLIPYAAACTLEASSAEVVNRTKVGKVLTVKLIDENSIQLGGGLCFLDAKILQAVKNGFALPQLIPLLLNLKNSFLLLQENPNINKISVGLRAGLSATAAFASYHHQCQKLLEDERGGVILFKVANTDIVSWLSIPCDKICKSGSGLVRETPAAIFTFKNLSVAERAIIGRLDHLGDPGHGEVEISGNLPLLDKIGYISRLAQKSVPSIL